MQNEHIKTVVRQIRSTLMDHISKKHKSLLLLGPRQTGKSFLLTSLNPDVHINLAKESVFQEHLKNPALIEKVVAALDLENGGLVFIDEIQRIPEMMNTVQAIIDDNKKIIFLLSGSSPRKLRKKEINLLPGRIFSHQLFPLTFWELGKDFDLNKCLTRGSLPEIYFADYGTALLSEYIESYLREEIMAEALVRNLASFSRFVDLAAVGTWQEINYSQWASDSEIPKENIRRYVDILSETLLIHRIPGFTQINSSRKAVQKEKYVFFDIGVRNGILGMQNNKFTNVELGHLFEQWIVLQIIAFNSYNKLKWNLYYYRDDKKTEVDLIIETSKKIIAIEIKIGTKYRSEWKASLETFAEQKPHPVAKTGGKVSAVDLIILYCGQQKLKDDKVTVIPYQLFLKELAELIDYMH